MFAKPMVSAAATASMLAEASGAMAGNGPELKYPDFGFMPQASGATNHAFQLSQDFPEKMPEKSASVKEILQTKFKGDNWKTYAERVKDYIFKGNISPEGYRKDFDVHLNDQRDWYHMPWMHWGPQGREGFHGLTREGPLAKQMLAPTQDAASHAYAVGIFNALGGYPIGQVWKQPGTPPDLSYFKNHKGFPEGTVIAKLLFTPLDKQQVPWLKNPITWNAYVVKSDVPGNTSNSKTKRTVADVHLLQMDIMVRDDRVKENGGWIFGTFTYNGRLGHENKWENLMPVGLMWGEDPDVTISKFNPTPTPQEGTKTNPKLDETVINQSEKLPAMHLGWGYRLNGPADNPKSSCMSCHSTAQYPNASKIMPFLADVETPKRGTHAGDDWMRWFRNLDWGESFDAGTKTVSTDFSLQLSKSIKRYVEYINQTKRGEFAAQYWFSDHKIRRNVVQD